LINNALPILPVTILSELNETERIVLILDLDEILIHTTETQPEIESDFQLLNIMFIKDLI